MKSLVMNKYSKARGMLRDCGSQEGNLVEFTIAQWQAIDTAIIETEAANADLLEALEQMSKWFDADGYANSVPPRVFVFAMREAIQKARES